MTKTTSHTTESQAKAPTLQRTFRDVLKELADDAQSMAEKGHSFERLFKAFLEQDKAQSERFAKVWLWGDWPGNGGRRDTGIDLVAEERDTGDLVAIQCKFYSEDNSIALEQLNKFLTAYGAVQFASGIIVATTDNWTRNAEAAIQESRTKPVTRWGPDIFENSSIDWSVSTLTTLPVLSGGPPRLCATTSRRPWTRSLKGSSSTTAAS